MPQPLQPSFHSINHWCQGEGGHFYHYHRSVEQAALASLEQVTIYLPLQARLKDTSSNWQQWFHAFYNRKNRRLFWKDCKRLFRLPEGQRIFFLEFFGRRDFVLIALAALLFAKRQDRLWILYRDDLTIRRKKDQQMIRWFSKLLSRRFGDHFLPLTDSELLADYYHGWFRHRPTVLPVPHTSSTSLLKRKAGRKRIVCFIPSGARPEQGPKLLEGLVEIQDPAAERMELYIPGNLVLPPEKNALYIQLRKACLSSTEYQAALERSDVILLPYDPKRYKWRTSGPFVEAVTLGILPLVLEGSWLAHELRRFQLEELIVDWKDPLFFTNLLKLLKDKEVQKKFSHMQASYRAYHSQESFSQKMGELFKL